MSLLLFISLYLLLIPSLFSLLCLHTLIAMYQSPTIGILSTASVLKGLSLTANDSPRSGIYCWPSPAQSFLVLGTARPIFFSHNCNLKPHSVWVNYSWSSPAQSFLVLGPAGLIPYFIICCLLLALFPLYPGDGGNMCL
jgi:hypothetical protein